LLIKKKYFDLIFTKPLNIFNNMKEININKAADYIKQKINYDDENKNFVDIWRNMKTGYFDISTICKKTFKNNFMDFYKTNPNNSLDLKPKHPQSSTMNNMHARFINQEIYTNNLISAQQYIIKGLKQTIMDFNKDLKDNITSCLFEKIKIQHIIDQIDDITKNFNIYDNEHKINKLNGYYLKPELDDVIKQANECCDVQYVINNNFVQQNYEKYYLEYRKKYIMISMSITLKYTNDIFEPIELIYNSSNQEICFKDIPENFDVLRQYYDYERIYKELYYSEYISTHKKIIVEKLINKMHYEIFNKNNDLEILVERKLINKYTIRSLKIIFYGNDKTFLKFIHYDKILNECRKLNYICAENNIFKLLEQPLDDMLINMTTRILDPIYTHVYNILIKIMCDIIIANPDYLFQHRQHNKNMRELIVEKHLDDNKKKSTKRKLIVAENLDGGKKSK
jgi:hypothetical protein